MAELHVCMQYIYNFNSLKVTGVLHNQGNDLIEEILWPAQTE